MLSIGPLKKNSSANGFPPIPVEVLIPVTIPEKPVAIPAPVIFSRDTVGIDTITWGGFACEYPKPGFTIVTPEISPSTTVHVAVAVDPIPVTVFVPSGMKLVGNPTENGFEKIESQTAI